MGGVASLASHLHIVVLEIPSGHRCEEPTADCAFCLSMKSLVRGNHRPAVAHAKLWAASRKASALLLFTSRVFAEMVLPLVMRLSGQSPSQEPKHLVVGKQSTKSGPSSVKRTRA